MSERAVALVSGGIDSPVAAAILSGKGKEIIPVHFVLHPYYCEETFSISIRALRKLEKVVNFKEMVLFPWGNVLEKIFEDLEKRDRREYSCVLCRRGMLKAADIICHKVDASSIVTGESIGQKASQTLDNLKSTSYGTEHPVLRPLLGMDKENIIKKSKELGIFMKKHAGCCNATPKNPRTKADANFVDKLFRELELGKLIKSESEEAKFYSTENTDLYEVFYKNLKDMVSEKNQSQG